MPDRPDYLTLAEAAQTANLTAGTLKQQIRNGRLEAVKLGRQWFTTTEWVQEYLNSRQRFVAPGPKPALHQDK